MQIQEVFDRRRFVFLDGGMGTQLQQRGLQPGQKPELAALEMPDVLTAIHRDYAAAGADILLANTFGANAKKLAGCGHSVEEVVSASIACARRAGQETGALVALDIGPLGELLAPAGTLAFEDAYEEFAQVIRAGAAAGAAAAQNGPALRDGIYAALAAQHRTIAEISSCIPAPGPCRICGFRRLSGISAQTCGIRLAEMFEKL